MISNTAPSRTNGPGLEQLQYSMKDSHFPAIPIVTSGREAGSGLSVEKDVCSAGQVATESQPAGSVEK